MASQQDEKDSAAFNYIEAAHMFKEKERKLLLDFFAAPFSPKNFRHGRLLVHYFALFNNSEHER